MLFIRSGKCKSYDSSGHGDTALQESLNVFGIVRDKIFSYKTAFIRVKLMVLLIVRIILYGFPDK